jgi:Fe-S cluster assembly protein SufD
MPDLSVLKHPAEQQLAAEWQARRDRLPGPSALREAAFRRFESVGLPHRRVEEWKYTDLRALMREAKPLVPAPTADARQRAKKAGIELAGLDARHIVFVDGWFVHELSDLSALEPGLKISSLADALTRGEPRVTARLGASGPAENNVAYALNTAFMGDGAVIEVAPGAHIARPIHLVFAYAAEMAGAVFPRSLVTVGAGARLTLIDSHEGPDGRDYQINTALDLALDDGAQVEHVKFGCEGHDALHIATLTAVLGRDVDFRDFSFTTGGGIVRNQAFVRCDGPGSTIALHGASLLKARQHVDTTLVLDHAVGGCQSREVFKSVLDDESRSVFQGKIVVRPDAQKTDARMMSQALLLSPAAEADNKPELEIFADDVQCGHGATAGALDENLKFYLMARGIPEREAETLLIQSFVAEAVEAIAHHAVKDALMFATRRWLGQRHHGE